MLRNTTPPNRVPDILTSHCKGQVATFCHRRCSLLETSHSPGNPLLLTEVSRIFPAQHRGGGGGGGWHNTGWVQNSATSETWQSCPVDVSASRPSRTDREQPWIVQFRAWSTTLLQARHQQNQSCTNCSLLCSCHSQWQLPGQMGPPWIVPWHKTSCCISVTSLSVVPLPSYPRMKGRASVLHRLDPHPSLMSYPLGCNYETRSLVGNGRMPCTVPQHPILRLGRCNLPPVLVGQLSGELPLDDNQPCSPPPLICGPFCPPEDEGQVAVPFVVLEGENRDCDCPCQDQSHNTPTFTVPPPRHSPELPQQVVALHLLITTKVGARLSLFCNTSRQNGCTA